jgi:hypothetical protein
MNLRRAGRYLDFIRSLNITRTLLLRAFPISKTDRVSVSALSGPGASVLFRPIRETGSSRKSEGIPDRQRKTYIDIPGIFHRLNDLPLSGASGAASLSITSQNSIKRRFNEKFRRPDAPSILSSYHLKQVI